MHTRQRANENNVVNYILETFRIDLINVPGKNENYSFKTNF